MAKVRWRINRNNETELVARKNDKIATIETQKDGTVIMEKVVKAYAFGIRYWKTESFVFFKNIERAKAYGEKWLTEGAIIGYKL